MTIVRTRDSMQHFFVNYVVARAKDKSRQLKSIYWKEFEPNFENGEIIHAKCIHCHDHLSGRQSIGTSHLKKHLECCKARSRVNVMVDRLRAGARPDDIDALEDWVYDYEKHAMHLFA
uniref:BED-type domain-containing protein n=1 Tax=Arundo donax TaxID=35708 RepID=A0A0A9H9D0_ARUDO